MDSTSKGRESDDILECSVCLEQYVNPKMLTCMHTFCGRCLEPLLKGSEISCPNCRYVTKVERDVNSLPTNWILEGKIAAFKWKESVKAGLESCSECEEERAEKFCTDCKLMLCKLCSAHHKRLARSKNHVIIDDVEQLNSSGEENYAIHKCEKHDEVLKYFCSSCQVNLCYDCTLGSSHRGHELALYNDVIQEKLQDLKSLIETGDIFSGIWEKRLKDARSILNDAATVKATSVKNVEDCFDALIDSLLKTKQDLINWLEAGHEETTKSIKDATKELNVLKSSLRYGSKLIDVQRSNRNNLNLLQAVSHCSCQIDEILACNDISSPCKNVHRSRSLIGSTDIRKLRPYVILREIHKVDVTRKFDDMINEIFDTKDCDKRTAFIFETVALTNAFATSQVPQYRKKCSVKVCYESPLRCIQTKYE